MVRHRHRHCLRLTTRFWSLTLLGLAARVVLGSPEPKEVTYQTVNVPVSPLQIDVGGEAANVPTELGQAKGTLTHVIYRLLHFRYGGCFHHINLDVSLEQHSKIHDPVLDDGHNGYHEQDEGRVVKEKAVLTAKGIATFYCRSADMPRISIKEIDDIIQRSIETIQHVASISFTAPSNIGTLYKSLVRIAFSNSSSISTSISSKRLESGGDDSLGKVS